MNKLIIPNVINSLKWTLWQRPTHWPFFFCAMRTFFLNDLAHILSVFMALQISLKKNRESYTDPICADELYG